MKNLQRLYYSFTILLAQAVGYLRQCTPSFRKFNMFRWKSLSLQNKRMDTFPIYFTPIKCRETYDLYPKFGPISFTQINTTKEFIKCYVISDLHADSERGQEWARKQCIPQPDISNNTFHCLLLPGDICTEIDRMKQLFDILVSRYDAVCFVPGNHEAWKQGIASGRSATDPTINSETSRMATDSVEKLKEILECARSFGVYIGPSRIQSTSSSSSVVIFPLYSWYHSSFDKEPDLTHPGYLAVEEAIPFGRKWGDFSLCSWPEELISHSEFTTTSISSNHSHDTNTRIAEAFGMLNEPFLYPINESITLSSSIKGSPITKDSDFVISFSHFLPRQELCPEKRFLLEPLLSRVIGSCPLEEQVYRLNPNLHLFGHTHIPIDLSLENIRYIQWPLGYSRESQRQCSMIYNTGPLLIYDSSLGKGKKVIPKGLRSQDAIWSEYYRYNPRQPNIVGEISPWLEKRLETFSGLVYTQQKRLQAENEENNKL